MKMYEKMGIDPSTEEGLIKIMGLFCKNIPDKFGEENGRTGVCPRDGDDCNKCKAERLFAEVPTKKVQRGTTYTDFKKAWEDYSRGKEDCVLFALGFYQWLAEEIEVEDVYNNNKDNYRRNKKIHYGLLQVFR